MEKFITATGKTIDLAIEAALRELKMDRDSVSVEVLENPKSGFLGFGAQPAKVQVTYEAPDPAPQASKSALSSASRSKPKAAAPVQKPQVPRQEVPKQEVKKPETPKPQKAEAPKPPKAPKVEAPKAPREFVPAAPGSVEEKIEVFLKGLLEHMGSAAVPHAWKDGEDSYRVELTGEDLGYLIGRRGDTLDALQHLCNYSVNRSVDGHIRISVDAEDYRQKREESLRRYARKKAQQVLKAHRRTTLEPMNAYERHLVHATLQDMDRITTHSVGTEPNRRVVIEYVR